MASATKPSRLVTTTILGVVFGVVCMLVSRYIEGVAFWPIGVSLLLHHTVMGFAIGASGFRINWAAHGVLWGVLFGIFLLIGYIETYPEPWALFAMPIVWAFLIELLATKVFKQAA
jgi:hypothetical protein